MPPWPAPLDRVDAALRYLPVARLRVEAVAARLSGAGDPTTASWSHIGAQQGRPGNPTLLRATLLLEGMERIERAAWLVDTLDPWLERQPEADRRMLELCYGLLCGADGTCAEPWPVDEAAEAAGYEADRGLAILGRLLVRTADPLGWGPRARRLVEVGLLDVG